MSGTGIIRTFCGAKIPMLEPDDILSHMKIPIIYSDSYYVNIGEHVFPTSKYRIIKDRLLRDRSLCEHFELIEPEVVSEKEISAVHDKPYLEKLDKEGLSVEEMRALEVPLSRSLLNASFICCGGTMTAAKKAMTQKAAIHLGGGFHHAFPEHGEGFCVLNDIAVSVRALKASGTVERALIVDCDLHQGNGTAFIFKDDPTVFTFSIHQENNYPFNKPKSDMDIGLRDYTGDRDYLQHLYDNIPKILSMFAPEVIIYLAGADPFENDQLGNLRITKEGLRERDNFICMQAFNFGVPIAITLAGGYAFNREDTVDIHYATCRECIEIFCGK